MTDLRSAEAYLRSQATIHRWPRLEEIADLLSTANDPEPIRRAITDEAWVVGKRFGLSGEQKAILATRMIAAVESSESDR